jgi:hypothetical protein
MRRQFVLLAAVFAVDLSLSAQSAQQYYTATSVTGQLALVRTVPAVKAASVLASSQQAPMIEAETPLQVPTFLHPNLSGPRPGTGRPVLGSRLIADRLPARPQIQSVPVDPNVSGFGFNGLSHYDQRQANSGNQFSVEPPNPSIAVANGYIVEGVNNAFRVFTTSGTPLTRTLSSNELFGLAPAINRTTGIYGVFPTDMRVFFDQDANRWFVLQRAQDEDAFGNFINQSHIYLAVSQTSDPSGAYNIYVMDTTNVANPGCPCVADFPQIGADQYGIYISANEYNAGSVEFIDATILAISKTALAAGASSPATFRFVIPLATGYEFAIQPAATPPGASHFVASGGVEYFVSSQAAFASDSNVALWALSNTASLQGTNTNLLLTQNTVATLPYFYPDVATQRSGPLPYGSSLVPSGPLAYIDGGHDSRILSLCYSGGRLFATFATQVLDDGGHSLVGAGYVILSPTLRNGVLAAAVLKQGNLVVSNNHILRPAISVNSQGRGAIAFTLVGPDYYPSSAFAALDTVSAPSIVHIAAPGAFPEDGFTGYPGGSGAGEARWGDYATAVTSTDGSIWMVSEYIPNAPRTQLANWGTFISKYLP